METRKYKRVPVNVGVDLLNHELLYEYFLLRLNKKN